MGAATEDDGTEAWGLAAVAAVDHDPWDENALKQEEELTESTEQAAEDEPEAAAAGGAAKVSEALEAAENPDTLATAEIPEALDAAEVPQVLETADIPETVEAAVRPELEPHPEPEPQSPDVAPTAVPEPEPRPASQAEPTERGLVLKDGTPGPTSQAKEPGPRQPSPAPLVVKSTLKGPPEVATDASLHRCAKEGDVHQLKALLRTMDCTGIAAKLATLDSDGWTPLHYAAVSSSTAALQELLVAGHGKAEVLNMRSREGQTALHFAVVWECPDHVELLLKAGADVDAVNEFGATPLHWACERGAHDVMRVLLDHSPSANAEAVDECGRTPLHVAAENDMLREAMILVKECGVRVDCKDRRGRTPFELASTEVCQVLQQACGISRSAGSGTAVNGEPGSSADLDVEFYEWVSANGLQAYIGTFRSHAIDLDALKVLDEAHLSEMGIPIGARMKILTGATIPQPSPGSIPSPLSVSKSARMTQHELTKQRLSVSVWSWAGSCRCTSVAPLGRSITAVAVSCWIEHAYAVTAADLALVAAFAASCVHGKA